MHACMHAGLHVCLPTCRERHACFHADAKARVTTYTYHTQRVQPHMQAWVMRRYADMQTYRYADMHGYARICCNPYAPARMQIRMAVHAHADTRAFTHYRARTSMHIKYCSSAYAAMQMRTCGAMRPNGHRRTPHERRCVYTCIHVGVCNMYACRRLQHVCMYACVCCRLVYIACMH